jgi:Ca-activated chloride channel homolog
VVEIQAGGSGETMDAILNGEAQPVLWSPASRIWLPLANDEWQQRTGSALVDESACEDLVLSPVVIMMWESVATALGYPNKQIGWADIANLSVNGWGADQAYLPRFRFGHTHPDYSNSGLQTIVAMAYAAMNKQRGLTEDDVRRASTVEFIHDVESSVAHYGSSTGFFGNAMIARGPQYLSAAVVYENIVVDSYRTNRSAEKLVAIYPREGTFLSDHPGCIIEANWVSDEQREAAQMYRDYLLATAQQQAALQYGFRPADPNIAFDSVISVDRGADPTQPQNTLAVPSAATIRAVHEVWEQQKRQVNLTLLIDISGSMQGDRIVNARNGAVEFVNQLADTDTLTLIAFDDEAFTVFQDLEVGSNRDEITRSIQQLQIDGGTALYDSIHYAVNTMTIDPQRINAVVVLTDGEDQDSRTFTSPDMLMQSINGAEGRGQDVSIFTIGYEPPSTDLERVLQRIAAQGRGDYRKGTAENISTIYRDISTFF